MATGGEQLIQRATRAVVRATLRRGASPPVEAARLRRILVVRTDDRVGNVLLTTPLLRALREGLPHVRIDWLVAARRRTLVDGLFLADGFVPYDRRRALRNPAALASFLWRLRSAAYDAVIDAAHYDAFSLTAALITRWSGAPIRIGHDRADAPHYYTHPVPPPSDTRYDVAAKLSLLEPLGLPARGIDLETSAGLSPGAVRQAADAITGPGMEPSRFFVVNPGARKPDRRFPARHVGAVARRIAEGTGLRPLIQWGPGEEDLARETCDSAGDGAAVAPAMDIHVLAAVLRHAALLLTNDTGPMHLAVACGVPTVALFTAGDSERWGHPLPAFRALDVQNGDPPEEAAVDDAVGAVLAARQAA